MRHFSARRNSSCVLTLLVFQLCLPSFAQKKESVWDKIKKAGQQGQQSQASQPSTSIAPNRSQGGQPPQASGRINDSGPFKPPAGTKIEETVLAPVQQGARFELSPRGVHVATITTDGSRAVVYYDGVEGPKFDQIISQDSNHSVVFSDDSSRFAYCARSGNAYVVMVDGKEVVRRAESMGGTFNEQTCSIGFTSNNKHFYYFSTVSVSEPSSLNFKRFVIDGRSDPPTATDLDQREVAFSPDGDHYAYVWNDPRKQKPWLLVVDGKPAPYQAGTPQWTNDSKHLYTQRHAPNSNLTELLFDGKPLSRAFQFRIFMPPVGDMVVVAVTGGSNAHPLSFLVVNGKKVPGSDTVERGMIDNVIFSPDGKHYAAICGDTSAHHYVIADGKRGQEYVSVDKLTFTPDSSKLVYLASVNGKQFIVIGDQEFGGAIGSVLPPVVAPAGNRVAALMSNNGTMNLLMDGKMMQLNARGASDLTFTPDGEHYLFFLSDGGMGSRLAIDSVVLQQQVTLSNDAIDSEHATAPKYVVSSDSKHFAHFALAETSSGPTRGVFLDGKFMAVGNEGANTKLVFSPDSNHVFWIHMYGNQPNRVFVDGKPLVDFYGASNQIGSIPHWWDFSPDGRLLFLAQDDNSLKRITITLSPETSLASIAGSAVASK